MRIDARYNGPADSAHGGVAAGRFAEMVGTPLAASVRLVAPPPLDADLRTRPTDGGVEIVDRDDTAVALVRELGEREIEPFPFVDADGLAAAAADWASRHDDMADPAYNTCFACGSTEARPDSLGLHAGRDPRSGYCAAPWVPEPTEPDGGVAPWMVWAALDCPAISAAYRDLPPGIAALTGELAVRIERLPVAGEQHQIVARWTGAERRRIWSEAALVDAAGHNLAFAWATTVVIGPRDVQPA
ncbi:MAG: hypothetical protein S0880_14310 [Actinomycetota bacterium]|nr:hypothetical protein [Actinomycetota bacterium]